MFFTGAPLSSVCEGDVLASEADDTGKYIATLVQRGSVVFLTLSSPDAVTLGETVVAEGLDSISPASAGSSGSSTSLSSAKIIWSSNAGTLVAWRSVENKLRAWDVEMLGSIDFRLPMPAWINAPPVNSAYALNTMQLNHVFCPAFPSGDAQAVCKAPGVGLLIATSDGGVVLTSWHGAPIRSYRYVFCITCVKFAPAEPSLITIGSVFEFRPCSSLDNSCTFLLK